MTITVKVVADSIYDGNRLTTMSLRYPRFIHSEFMTHRVFSRNASSSRAIPIERMIQDVIDDPAMPVAWGTNKPGMQAGPEGDNHYIIDCKDRWLTACEDAVENAERMASYGVHKQIVNRLLEPFSHISVVVSATEWQNFFDLRCHPDADPTINALAVAMRSAIQESTPVNAEFFHLPYVTNSDWKILPSAMSGFESFAFLAMISAARCARVSYLNHDGTNPDVQKDLDLAERLVTSKHMSPFEHQAMVTNGEGTSFWGNFKGWDQHRKFIESRE